MRRCYFFNLNAHLIPVQNLHHVIWWNLANLAVLSQTLIVPTPAGLLFLPSLLQVGATVRLTDLATNWSLGLIVLSLAKKEQLSVSCPGLSEPSNVIRGRKQIFLFIPLYGFPIYCNTVPGPQRTGDYAVVPWRSGPLALHTCRYEVFNISFHRSGRLSVPEKYLLAKKEKKNRDCCQRG